ncbi:hypothetical protein Ahy_A04g018985 isoform A [Arachis hypogaea]|uniref:Uncharacterized protein n=1 Tax=Arachis hypogaea TaxID=3818 RepID=A0A445DF44_ARAHY|nr:hypothetical protein Ahy_A04g018985 isoform A [Arachis hypogaea]
MLEDVCERCDHLTSKLCLEIKKALITDEGFRHRHLTNRDKRALARSSKYTSGLATFIKTKVRLLKSLDCDATLVEVFNGEGASGSAASVVDPDAVWHESTFAPYKNFIYGLGSFFGSNLRTSTLRPSSASITCRAIDLEECIYLRLQAQKLTETRERYQEIFTHVMDMDDLRLRWREQLKQLQRIE